MQDKKPKDYQTMSLFIILGALTVIIVLLLKVVLFSPQLLHEMAVKF